jgi:hypothetical protein
MRFIPTKVHGMLDYAMGLVLILAPFIFNFNRGGAETWIPALLGAGVILYSLFTNYELGLMRKIPMSVHLMLDLGGGILLAVSPFLFGFSEYVWAPHVILGIAEIGAALMTKKETSTLTTGKNFRNLAHH